MMKDKDLGPVLNLFKDEIVTLTRINYPRAAKLKDFPKDAQKSTIMKKTLNKHTL